jgi:hypothetical protein
MSAMICVNAGDCIHLITDGIGVDTKTGIPMGIYEKQRIIRRFDGLLVAGIAWGGYAPAALDFANRALLNCMSFDELFDASPSLWKQTLEAVPPVAITYRDADGTIAQLPIVYSVVVAGLSEATGSFKMFDLSSLYEPDGADLSVVANGPLLPVRGPEAEDPLNEFTARFADTPCEFEPARDGVDFMQSMRQQTCRFAEGPPRSLVGGFVQLTTLSRTAFRSEVLHTWPDVVGKPIALAA